MNADQVANETSAAKLPLGRVLPPGDGRPWNNITMSLEDLLARMEHLVRSQKSSSHQAFHDGSGYQEYSNQGVLRQQSSSDIVHPGPAFLEQEWPPQTTPLIYPAEVISMESSSIVFPPEGQTTNYQAPWDPPSRENSTLVRGVQARNWVECRESNDAADVSNMELKDSTEAPQTVNEEQEGPEFWLAMCSPPVLAWVYQKTGLNDFAHSAQELTSTWFRRMKMDGDNFITQNREPDRELAWQYCNAYFEQSIDSVFDAVDRQRFEDHLRAYFRGDPAVESGPAFYALRNTVYASGCRIYRSKDPSASFSDVQEEAWRYFQNALSVYGELLLKCTDLIGVRSLLAMTLFAEGLGSPALGYMLCVNAARLAQSQKLHHQPAISWNLDKDEVIRRNWLFWAVYCCEKQLAHRCGRPSAIDDDEISCEVPIRALPGSTIDIEGFTHLIRQSQITSEISRRLMSAGALRKSPSKLLDTARELEEQIESWRDSAPETLRPKDNLKSFQVPRIARPLMNIIIHYSYYGNLIGIHTLFAYPWMFQQGPNPKPNSFIDEQMVTSSNRVADAARNIIIMARHLEIDGTSTQGSILYYPMISLIHLFLFILQFPTLPSARSDVALLDVAAGYFAHIDIVTASELSFPFARDVAVLARIAVNKAISADDSLGSIDGIEEQTGYGMEFGAEDTSYDIQDFTLDDWSIPLSGPTEDEPI